MRETVKDHWGHAIETSPSRGVSLAYHAPNSSHPKEIIISPGHAVKAPPCISCLWHATSPIAPLQRKCVRKCVFSRGCRWRQRSISQQVAMLPARFMRPGHQVLGIGSTHRGQASTVRNEGISRSASGTRGRVGGKVLIKQPNAVR